MITHFINQRLHSGLYIVKGLVRQIFDPRTFSCYNPDIRKSCNRIASYTKKEVMKKKCQEFVVGQVLGINNQNFIKEVL